MNKKASIILIFFMTFFLTSCVQKEIYLTPEVTGYVYSSITNKPLSGKNGLIGFNGLTPNNAPNIALNSDGSFTLKPIIKKYYFFRPDMNNYAKMPSLIYISIDGFKVKDIDYSEEKYKKIPVDNKEFRHYKKIELGVIYLDKEE